MPVVIGRVEVAERASDTARTARLAGEVGSLIQELQQERLLSVAYLIGASSTQPAGAAERRRHRQDRRPARLETGLPAEVRAALDALPPLATVRAAVLLTSANPLVPRANPLDVLNKFNVEITRLISALRLTHKADTTTSEGQQILALDAVLRADEGVSMVAPYILIMARDEGPPARHPVLGDLREPAEGRRTGSGCTRRPSNAALYDEVQKASDARTGADFLTGFAANPQATIDRLDPVVLFPVVESLIDARPVHRVEDHRGRGRRRDPAAAAGDLTEAYVVGALCLLVLLLAMLLSVAVARAVARPLTHLTRSADRVAQVAEAELVRVADGEIDAGAPIRLDPVDIQRPGRGRRPGPGVRPGAGHRGPAGRAAGRQPAERGADVRPRRPAHAEPGRPAARADRPAGAARRPTRAACSASTGSTTSPAGCAATRAASSCSPARPAPTSHVAPLPLADVVRLALGEIEDYTRVDVEVPDRHRAGAGGHRRPGAGARRADGERHDVLAAAHPGHRHRRA